MEDANKWYALNEKMEEFMYGEKGIVTTAFADENLNTYFLDTDKKDSQKIKKDNSIY